MFRLERKKKIKVSKTRRHTMRPSLQLLGLHHIILNRRPPGLPTAYWRYVMPLMWIVRLTGLILGAGIVAIGIALFVDLQRTLNYLNHKGISWLMVIVIVHAALLIIGEHYTTRAFARKLRRSSWKLCSKCGFLLAGLPDRHKCPECGKSFDLEVLKQKWMDWVKSATGSNPVR